MCIRDRSTSYIIKKGSPKLVTFARDPPKVVCVVFPHQHARLSIVLTPDYWRADYKTIVVHHDHLNEADGDEFGNDDNDVLEMMPPHC